MTRRETIHRLVDAIPERDLATVERMLRGLKLPVEEEARTPPRPRPEERRDAVERLRSAMKGRVSTEEYLREKHEEIEREEAQQHQKSQAQ